MRSLTLRAALPACLAIGLFVAAHPFQDEPILLGEGTHAYEWVRGWGGELTHGNLGSTHGCVVVDHAGRVYVNTDTEDAVVVLSPDGERLAAWGKELAGGLHGMTLVERDGKEQLYLTHTGRHQVLATTLEGEVLWTVGWPEASGHYASADEYRPTSIAVRPDGGFYVADGYGKSWIHQYDAEHRYVRSFGGPGSEPGQLQTPHGLLLDTRGETPVLLVADRENGRVQAFDLEGKFLRVVASDLKRPCNLGRLGDLLLVPELAGGVVLLDGEGRLIERLGENPDPALRATNQVPVEQWTDGRFLAPHSACFGRAGEVYVMDWSVHGRVSKLVPRV